jgi:hypothetical protein
VSDIQEETPTFELDSDAAEGWSGVRLATRYSFDKPIAVQVNGTKARLCDLSVCGCQVRSDKALKPDQLVRVHLPSEPQKILCVGRVVWSRREPVKGDGAWRAGIAFTQADEVGIEAFTIMHAAL